MQRGLVTTVSTLIDLGADVNSVADNDILPLNLASAIDDSENHSQIKELLLKK